MAKKKRPTGRITILYKGFDT